MHDFGAAAGHFKHLVVGEFVHFAGVFHHARVAGEDAFHVGENLAQVGFDRGGDGDGGEVGAAPAQRGRLAVVGFALESGNDDDVSCVEKLVDLVRRDVADLRLGMDAVGDDARLRSGERDGFVSEVLDGHGGERDGGLLACGQQCVHFALGRGDAGADFAGQLDQAIRDARHRGDHDDDLVARLLRGDHAARDVEDAAGVAD